MANIDHKISAFLEAAGYEVAAADSPRRLLLKYFEDRYGTAILEMLVHEWLDEQSPAPRQPEAPAEDRPAAAAPPAHRAASGRRQTS